MLRPLIEALESRDCPAAGTTLITIGSDNGYQLQVNSSGRVAVLQIDLLAPGIGYRIYQAILAREYIALQSYIALIAIAYVLVNFAVDILYSVLDPRIRHVRAAA